MDLYGKQSKSIPQKATIHLLELGLLALSACILFSSNSPLPECLQYPPVQHNFRRNLLFAFNIILFLRMSYMMLFLLKRRIPWSESLSVPLAFALYYLGFSLFVLPTDQPFDGIDAIAIFLFLAGSILNTGGEILRNQWKKQPQNKGKIYTGGFFRYSRHINYFGDLLWVTAYALLTRNPWASLIPLLLFAFFAFYNAPKLDRYLQQKYGQAYDSYAQNTKMLIPFIY